mgnify:CR=1 FL=1
MLVLFYVKLNGQPIFLHLIDKVTPGNVFAGENLTRHIANAHTVFNVFNAVMLFPFINKLGKLTEYIIPGDSQSDIPPVSYIDDRLASSPTVALLQARKELGQINQYVRTLATLACYDLSHDKKRDIKKPQSIENTVNTLHDRLTHFLIGLDISVKTEWQHIKTNHLIHTADHLERAADYAMGLIQRAHDKSITMPDELFRLITPLFDTIADMLTYIDARLSGEPPTLSLTNINQRSLELENMLRREHLNTMRNKHVSIRKGLVLSSMINDIERLGAHLNKAGRLIPNSESETG